MKVYELVAALMKVPAGNDVNLFMGATSFTLYDVEYKEGLDWVSLYISEDTE